MSLFRGLFVRPDATRGTTPVEARKSLAGMFHRLAAGGPRAGLLAPAQVVGTAGWTYSVPAVPMLLARGAADGVVLAGNDGALPVPTDPAPATGSRIDIVYAIHHDVDQADVDSAMVVAVAIGIPSGTPVAPSIPAGAMELARATVPSTASNTLGATISQTAPYTGLAGADIVAPFGLSAFATRIPDPPDGLRVYSTTEAVTYVRSGGTWVPAFRAVRPFADVIAEAPQSMANGTETEMTYASAVENVGGMWSDAVGVRGRLTASVAGIYEVTYTSSFAAPSTAAGSRIVVVRKNGATHRSWAPNSIVSGQAASEVYTFPMRLAAGDYISVNQYQSSGAALNTHNQSYPRLSAVLIG
ncbi:hypothetical protein ACQP60_04155 [Isoptericola variabilis]|uniref:hypothetical protein n=1 Tax=Isoptericola variabilis TaxID=139208 RepID=UPI003D1A8DB0